MNKQITRGDQAAKLRQIVDGSKKFDSNQEANVLTVLSGKGGVGKSSLAVNLSLALKDLNKKVLLIDGKLGLFNLDILFGVSTGNKLENLLTGNITWQQALVKVAPGIDLICGGKNQFDIKKLNFKFIDEVKKHSDYDFVIIDSGSGVNEINFAFANMSDLGLVVTTSELTAVTDTYALIKSFLQLKVSCVPYLIVNRCEKEKEAYSTWKQLNRVLEYFVDTKIDLIGLIHEDKTIPESIKQQQPALLLKPYSPAGTSMRNLAKKILSLPTYSLS